MKGRRNERQQDYESSRLMWRCCASVLRFCEEVFQGPVSVQEQWIAHLQKHILSLGYKGKASPPAAPVAAPALVEPVAV